MLWSLLQREAFNLVLRQGWRCFALAFLLIFIGPSPLKAAIVTQPEPGVFKIESMDWYAETVLLEGKWRFFPQELLSPADARARFAESQPIKIPGAWNKIQTPAGSPMGAHGYGTYIARLDGLPGQDATMSLRLQYATSNYRLYWLRSHDTDVDVLMEAGRIGRSIDESLPQFLEQLRPVAPLSKPAPAWIVVQVSNYHWVEGGMFYAPEIGLSRVMERSYNGRFIGSLLLSGMFIMLMLYNLSVYLRQRDDTFALWLMLVAGVALLATSTFFSQLYYYVFTPSVRAHQLFRYGQNSFGVLVLTVFNQLVYLQYPRQAKRWIAIFMWAIAITAQFVYALSPFTMPLTVLRINQALVLSFPFLVTWQVFLAFRAGEENSGLSLLGFACFFASLLNDLLVVFRVVTLPMLSNWGLMIMIFMQTQLLAIKYAQAFDNTRDLSRTLAEWNQTLEHRVALQTREIRSLLTHVKIGIFGLVGSGKQISKDYSQQLEVIFEDRHLEGRPGLELLLQGTDLLRDEMDQIDQVLNTCLGEEEINFQLNEHVLPRSLKRRDKQGQLHQFELTWDTVLNEHGRIEMILVTVNDVTQLRQLESVAQRHSVELAMVGEILAVREEAFRRFLMDARELLQHSRFLLQADSRPPDTLRLILIDVHTLKGSARTLHLNRLTEALHLLERRYRGRSLDDAIAASLLKEVEEALDLLRDYENIATQKLRWDADTTPTVRIEKDALERGFAVMKRLLPRLSEAEARDWKPLFQLLQAANEVPLDEVLKNLLQMANRVAADVGKPPPQLDIEVPSLTCNEAMAMLLRKVLVHIVRNMMDHGIESPDERRAQGKNPAGLISVHASVRDGDITLLLWDDGRGLDLQELARSHGAAPSLGDQALADLMFEEGVSTAKAITDISGHGLGMAAVKRFIEERGGEVRIILDEGPRSSRRPFQLSLRFPLDGFTQNPFSNDSAA
ncbi:MAG TPA: ATP-binding protein [Oligoflexus sp.]|uniref:ATP-binding protein n=1 Tax=Oligoflexus sp. TaxID=1971216 RepID=UPI002D7F10FC|nr:ATP-binding protein [Oligoflexus sp.]HET9237232.1 ATP-binding protein [Oligoflexus sp.]